MLIKRKHLAYLFIILISHQLKGADTLILSANPKHEIGLNYCPVTFIKWNTPNYSLFYAENNGPDNYKKGVETLTFTYCGMSYFNNIKNNIWIGLNINYSTQGTYGNMSDKQDPNFNKDFSLNIYQKIFHLNIAVSAKIKDTKLNKSGTRFTLGLAPEITNTESGWTMTVKEKDGTILYREQDFKTANKKYEFVRITPSISIQRFRFNSKRNFSFNYGSSFSFRSIYEIHNHAEYLKNYKILPIILGLSYHFK
jgi:hypothetical protein